MAMFVPFLIAVGGQVIRVATQAAATQAARLGIKKISEAAAKRLGGRILTARGADDTARLFAKYGKDIAKYRPATQVKPATKVVKPKPKPDAKPKDKPKSNVRADRKPVRGSRIDVKPNAKKLKPDTKVKPGSSKRIGDPSKRPATGGPAKSGRGLTTKQKLALGAIGIGGATAAVDQLVKPKDAKSSPRKTSGPTTRGSRKPPSKNKTRVTKEGAASKRMPTIKSEDRAKDSAVSPKPNNKKASPTVNKSAAASKRMPTVKKPTPKVDKSAAASKRMPKRTNITAGPNTGFGPKGNIFPKNAEDRKRLMDLYGGTGSRAAKAAAAGTQGTLKKRK